MLPVLAQYISGYQIISWSLKILYNTIVTIMCDMETLIETNLSVPW